MASYPNIKPIMDITAALLVYTRRPASHVDGSGKVSKNHSWNTGGNLASLEIKMALVRNYRSHIGRTSFANNLRTSLSLAAFLILSNMACISGPCSCTVRPAFCYLVTYIPNIFYPLRRIMGGGQSALLSCPAPIE